MTYEYCFSFEGDSMQSMVDVPAGSHLMDGILLIVGATLPLIILLTSSVILIKTKTRFVPQSSDGVEFQQRLGTGLVAVALLVCFIPGIFLLRPEQSPMFLAWHLGIIPGLVLGIVLGIWAQTITVQIGLYGTVFTLLMSPWLIYEYVKARLAGEKFSWMEGKLFLLPVSFLLAYGGYAFWIAQQTGSPRIGFWATLASALVTALIATDISLLLEVIMQAWRSPQEFAPGHLSVLAQSYRYSCMVVMGLVLPLLLLSLIGGIICSFPA